MEKKPILNIMVDLETTAKTENAGILSWAMVAFAVNGEEIPDFTFERVVKLRSCFFAGMFVDPDTQNWWIKQDPRAIHHIVNEEGYTIQSVAKDAYMQLEALAENHDIYLWSRGIDFDLPKIKWCFERLLEKDEKDFPFKFSHKMDVRTVLKFMQIDQSQFEFKGVPHISLDDCMHDIEMIQATYRYRTIERDTEVKRNSINSEKLERSRKEAEQEGWLELPELGMLFEQYYAIGSSVILYREDMKRIDDELRRLNTACSELTTEKESLNQQLKNLQAKG